MKTKIFILLVFLFLSSCIEKRRVNEGFFIFYLKSGGAIKSNNYFIENDEIVYINDGEIETRMKYLIKIDTVIVGFDSIEYDKGYMNGQIDATNNIYKWEKVLQDNGEIIYQRTK